MNNLLNTNFSAIADIVALVFIACFALWGFMRGFTKTFFSVFGKILAFLFATLLAPTVAKFLEDKFSLITTISNGIQGFLTNMFGEQVMNATLEQATSQHLSSAGVAGFLVQIILSLKADPSIPGTTTLKEIICPTFAYYIAVIIAVIALYIIFRLIFFLIGEVVKKMHTIKLVATLDKGLGFALGLINGIVNLEILIMVIKIIPIALFQDVYLAIQSSTVASFIENINLFGLLLGSISVPDISAFIKGIIG